MFCFHVFYSSLSLLPEQFIKPNTTTTHILNSQIITSYKKKKGQDMVQVMYLKGSNEE